MGRILTAADRVELLQHCETKWGGSWYHTPKGVALKMPCNPEAIDTVARVFVEFPQARIVKENVDPDVGETIQVVVPYGAVRT